MVNTAWWVRLVQPILCRFFVIVISLQTVGMPFYFHRDVGGVSIVMEIEIHRDGFYTAS